MSAGGKTDRLRIGFLGNTNNYPFMLARALRTLGHDVVVYLDSASALHRPESRYADISRPYPDWIVDASALRMRDHLLPTRAGRWLRSLLRQHDFLVVNGLGPSMVSASTTPAFAVLTGSDLEYLAAPASIRQEFNAVRQRAGLLRAMVGAAVHAVLVHKQRTGLRRCLAVNYFARGLVAEGDCMLDALGLDDARRTAFMLSGVDGIEAREPDPKTPAEPVRVFNVARLNWRFPVPAHMCDLDMKGTDVLLAGVAQFVAAHGPRLQLVLVRKGQDVAATEGLVNELGLEDVVQWLDEMTQRDVLREYQAADIVTDQLSISVVGMGGLDAMAAGRPVIANARPEIFERLVGEPTAMFQARTADEVCCHLERLVFDADQRRVAGVRSRRYVEAYFSPMHGARQILRAMGHAA